MAVLIGHAVDQLAEGLIIMDANDNTVFLNQKAKEIGQWEPGVQATVQRLRAGRKRSLTTTVETPHNGRVYRCTLSILRDECGHHIGTTIMFREITLLRRIGSEADRSVKGPHLPSRRLAMLMIESMEALVDVLDSRLPHTLGHSSRVRDLAVAMARERWGASDDLLLVSLAGQLHDIGKVAVEHEILTKPGKLTAQEWEVVKTHPTVGELILKPTARIAEVAEAIRHHHERFDGSGYPDRLSGDDIPPLARILAIADSYDAMTSTRPYRDAMLPSEAVEEIRSNAGILYDPEWVEVFLRLMSHGRHF